MVALTLEHGDAAIRGSVMAKSQERSSTANDEPIFVSATLSDSESQECVVELLRNVCEPFQSRSLTQQKIGSSEASGKYLGGLSRIPKITHQPMILVPAASCALIEFPGTLSSLPMLSCDKELTISGSAKSDRLAAVSLVWVRLQGSSEIVRMFESI